MRRVLIDCDAGATLTPVVAQLMSCSDPETMGQIVVDGARGLVDDVDAIVSVWRGDGPRLTRVALSGEDPNDVATIDVSLLPAPLGDV